MNMATTEREKMKVKEWKAKNHEHWLAYKREWTGKRRELERAGVLPKKYTLTYERPPKPSEHCERCDMLFTYGGEGDGKRCDECLNELGIL